MNLYKHIVTAVAALTLAACSDYLEIYPENALPADKYWQSKGDVEATLFAGYYTLRSSVESCLIPWGELRAGCIRNEAKGGSSLQNLNIQPGNSVCSWGAMYQIVNDANLVLANAERAQAADNTYKPEEMASHLTEAYFLRALAYFYIVRNWRDAPLQLIPAETDNVAYNLPKSSEADILAQIKSDLQTAIDLQAAKDYFDTTWETKGRATRWAIYALAADVALYSQDFQQAIEYADMILDSKSVTAPRFMPTATHSSWFAMFNPGNSDESIFELQYSIEKRDNNTAQNNTQSNNLPILFGNYGDLNSATHTYCYSSAMVSLFLDDIEAVKTQTKMLDPGDLYVRTCNGAVNKLSANDTKGYCWKYYGGSTLTTTRTAATFDPNFIIYRVADVMLMKAEALAMRSAGGNAADNAEALALVNKIRQRTNLPPATVSDGSLVELLHAILHERIMELAGEGKAWYDFLRLGRYKAPGSGIDFKQEFLINSVMQFNESASSKVIRQVLGNEDAWYLPVKDKELTTNPELTQNPYYE